MTQIALIRGINVGKAKRVPMAGLRDALSDLGFENVRTLLNSGNVVFEAGGSPASNATRIERVIESRFAVSARVLGLSAADLEAVALENPLADFASDPSRLLVGFPFPGAELAPLVALAATDWDDDRLAVGSRAVYVWCAQGVLKSAALSAVGRAAGDALTTRNWRTVLALEALARTHRRSRD